MFLIPKICKKEFCNKCKIEIHCIFNPGVFCDGCFKVYDRKCMRRAPVHFNADELFRDCITRHTNIENQHGFMG
jgi:hypothetical protein